MFVLDFAMALYDPKLFNLYEVSDVYTLLMFRRDSIAEVTVHVARNASI